MALFGFEWDHTYSRMGPREGKCTSRLGVPTCERLLRMETVNPSLPKCMQTYGGGAKHRFVCIKTNPPTETLHELEARSRINSSGCNTTGLASILPICFPPLLSHNKGITKSENTGNINVNCNTPLAISNMVPLAAGYEHQKPLFTTKT